MENLDQKYWSGLHFPAHPPTERIDGLINSYLKTMYSSEGSPTQGLIILLNRAITYWRSRESSDDKGGRFAAYCRGVRETYQDFKSTIILRFPDLNGELAHQPLSATRVVVHCNECQGRHELERIRPDSQTKYAEMFTMMGNTGTVLVCSNCKKIHMVKWSSFELSGMGI